MSSSLAKTLSSGDRPTGPLGTAEVSVKQGCQDVRIRVLRLLYARGTRRPGGFAPLTSGRLVRRHRLFVYAKRGESKMRISSGGLLESGRILVNGIIGDRRMEEPDQACTHQREECCGPIETRPGDDSVPGHCGKTTEDAERTDHLL